MTPQSLTAEQQQRMEANRQRALKLRAEKLAAMASGSVQTTVTAQPTRQM